MADVGGQGAEEAGEGLTGGFGMEGGRHGGAGGGARGGAARGGGREGLLGCGLVEEADAKDAPAREFRHVAVKAADFGEQGAAGGEAVGVGVGGAEIGEARQRIDMCNVYAAQAGDEGLLAGLDAGGAPEADGLRLGAGADQGEESGLEEKHGVTITRGRVAIQNSECRIQNVLGREIEMQEMMTARMRAVGLMFGIDGAGAERPIALPEVRIPQAGIVLVTGPSGSGKSTLLRQLVGRLKAGEEGAGRRSVQHLERIGLPARAVVDCLALPLEATLELLSRAGLAEARLWLREAAALSEGEKFRLRLALWMARRRAPILVADEFANSLDRVAARAVAWQLRKGMDAAAARGQGRLALVATAHEDLAADLMPAVHVRLA